MLALLFQNGRGIIEGLGLLATFILTSVLIVFLKGKLPQDQGRAFAVEGALSKGKARGVGIIFVPVYALMTLILVRPSIELSIYLGLIILSMLTGFFDDASEKPWNEYKKGALDFLIAAGITLTYIFFSGHGFTKGIAISLALFKVEFEMPVWLFAILAIILIWVSINVTNCTDGVDGLSATVSIVTLLSFYVLIEKRGVDSGFGFSLIVFIVVLLSYLLFNATPSLVLMGDAGSRAMGTIIAIAALKSMDPFIFIAFALVLILDGGLGLIKVSLKRFLKISIMKNIRTPLHDQARKVMGWSNTQVVFRFAIIQAIISFTVLWLIK